MVAYSFKARFAAPIVDRIKPHTLRGRRPRHARPGEEVQLYTGMRTKHCRLIGRATCDRLQAISIDFTSSDPIMLCDVQHPAKGVFKHSQEAMVAVAAPEAFAISDGFDSLEDMARFWRDEHDVSEWDGILIGWDVTTLILPEPREVAA